MFRTLFLSVWLFGGSLLGASGLQAADSCNAELGGNAQSLSTLSALIDGFLRHHPFGGGIFQLEGDSCGEWMPYLPVDKNPNGLFEHPITSAQSRHNNRGDVKPSMADRLTECTVHTRLTAIDSMAGDVLGSSVAVKDDLAVVGAPQDSHSGPVSGSAYVFRFDGTNWIEEQMLTAPNETVLENGIWYGRSVAVDGDTIVVGGAIAGGEDEETVIGAAYIYRFDGIGWVYEQELIASKPAKFDFFGTSVAVEGDNIVVGAPGCIAIPNGNCFTNLGLAYVFVHDGTAWVEQAQLALSEPMSFGAFWGSPVAIDGNTVVVGGALDINDDMQTGSGSAVVFVRTDGGWDEQVVLTVSDPNGLVWFGQSVGLDSDTVILGSPIWGVNEKGSLGPISSLVHVFTRTGSDWIEQGMLAVPEIGANQISLGVPVAVEGDRSAVGRPVLTVGDDGAPISTSGSVYVFARFGDMWSELIKLPAPSEGTFDQFAVSLGMEGNTVIVGANAEDAGAGAAYVFDSGECDSDGDGLRDDWEINGIPYIDSGGNNRRFELPEADPLHKDLYVEVDARIGFSLSDATVTQLETAFANAPLSNPDKIDGITLHVYRDETNLSNDNPVWVTNSSNCWPVDFDDWRSSHYGTLQEHGITALLNAKSKAYRYCIVADTASPASVLGCGRTPGDDFVIFANGRNQEQLAAVFMHELGHNLGLTHGGPFTQLSPDERAVVFTAGERYNAKPNYPSIMNYVLNYRSPWNTSFWELDYSRADAGDFEVLDESFLNERLGIGTTGGQYRDFRMPYGVSVGSGANLNRDIRYLRLNGATGEEEFRVCQNPSTDFGDTAGTMFQDCFWNVGVEQDLNYFGDAPQTVRIPSNDRSFPQTLIPYDDWAHVNLPLAATLGDLAPSFGYPTDELTVEGQEWIDENFPLPPDVCLADIDSDGQSGLLDFSLFAECTSGAEQPVILTCERTDLDVDGDVDLTDFELLQASFGCP